MGEWGDKTAITFVGGATSQLAAMLLLPLLVCLVAGPLTGAVGGEPPAHPDAKSLPLGIDDLTTKSPSPDSTPPPSTAPGGATPSTTTIASDITDPTTTAPEDTTEPATTIRDPTTETSTTVTPETAETGGREGGSEVQEVSSDPDTDAAVTSSTTTSQPDGDQAEPPADSGEMTAPAAAAAGEDRDTDTTAAPETGDQPTTVVTTADADEHLTTAAAEEEDKEEETTTAPPTDALTTTPAGQGLGETLRPEQPTLSRHRADPGLAPSETKTSKARTGVLDPEMLDNRSKPRKGAPPSYEPAATSPSELSSGLSDPEGTPAATDGVLPALTTPSSVGGGFFGEDTLTGSSPTVRPKPAEASDAAGYGPRGSTVAGVVILVLLSVVIGFFVFRKVRETWYRRHYRKMDFLVDGMYNL